MNPVGDGENASTVGGDLEGPLLERLKAAFFEYNRDVRIASSKIAFLLVMILLPLGASLDYFVYPKQFGFFFVLRVICSGVGFVLWALLGTSIGQKLFRIFCMGAFAVPAFFISLMIYFSEGVHSPYYAGLNLLLIGVSWVAQIDFFESVIASSLTIIMYGAACLAHGGGTFSEYFSNFFFISLTGLIVTTGCYSLYRLRFREFALRAELDSNQQELRQTNDKLVELDRAKSAFFANVSHELRTPLTLLIGPLDRLRHHNHPVTPQERSEMLDIMYNNAMRLLRLINDLLDLVRLDSGAIRVRREELELRPFLEGIAKSVSPMAEQRKLHFDTQFEPLAHTSVHVDPDKLEKIILNLLFNSFKFTPEDGRVVFSAAVCDGQLSVTIRDTGKGISAVDLPRIFDRFWQAEAASTRRYQGVGIGLALVKELAEAHGGSVRVQSEEGKGTMIAVTVDALPDGDPKVELEPPPTVPAVHESEWLTQLYRRAELFPAHVIAGNDTPVVDDLNDKEKPLVLVADDEPEMRRFLISQLKDIYSVREARNGSEALELARSCDFALLLLDLMMPGIDGITLTQQLREEPRTKTVPIIILTARADEDSKIQALEAGVTDFLTKPFASAELAVRCRNLVLQRQLQQDLASKMQELETALEQIKDTEVQLVHQAKMASLGQLSAGLMHEINNPLNFANTAAHLLQKRLGNISFDNRDSLDVPLRDLQDGIRRVADIVTRLRSFSHPDMSSFQALELERVIETAARFVQLSPGEIELEIDIANNLRVWGNENQLVHLFINLLQNAIDSLREKAVSPKKITVTAVLQDDRVLVYFEDNGKGIKPEDQNKVFDAFFTTKPVGSGVGLGLNITHRIVQNHQGNIQVESKENEFCRFIISLKSPIPL